MNLTPFPFLVSHHIKYRPNHFLFQHWGVFRIVSRSRIPIFLPLVKKRLRILALAKFIRWAKNIQLVNLFNKLLKVCVVHTGLIVFVGIDVVTHFLSLWSKYQWLEPTRERFSLFLRFRKMVPGNRRLSFCNFNSETKRKMAPSKWGKYGENYCDWIWQRLSVHPAVKTNDILVQPDVHWKWNTKVQNRHYLHRFLFFILSFYDVKILYPNYIFSKKYTQELLIIVYLLENLIFLPSI